jgi:hypothetical protein
MHLALAEEMLRRSDLSVAARRRLREQRGPFLLGHTAPDVRTVSGQKREACHFYTVPRTSDRPAYHLLFDEHPSLRSIDALSSPQIAFMAGYVAHLLLDELWLDDIFHRFLLQDWGTLGERLFLHNVLRTWMDDRAQEDLDDAVASTLREVELRGWLPFVDDEHLRVWRDWLVEQLAPDRRMETAAVLAERMDIPAEEIEAVAQSPEQMQKRIFRHFPRSALASFRQKGYECSIKLVDWYVGGRARRVPELALPDLSVCQSIDP